MTLRPTSVEELQRQVAAAAGSRTPVPGWDLSALGGVGEYTPEDLTVTVGAGMTLGALQECLGAHGQWIPLDPPGGADLPLERLLATQASGPRRLGYGTARDWVIGLRAVLGDGQLIHTGGRVVKNVAGFDLMKLFIGGGAAAGILVEATFKVAPRPEAEAWLRAECADYPALGRLVEAIAATSMMPVALDGFRPGPRAPVLVHLAFAGCREEVEWQAGQAVALGFRPGPEPAGAAALAVELPVRLSVPPSELPATLARLDPPRWVARLGNGVAHLPRGSGPVADPWSPGVARLATRVKELFDPAGILPPWPVPA
ncbi:MAG: FAD-binding oxidoreductase [Verrucomicrobiota bacterium]